MSLEAGTSVLDEALAHLSQRISSILVESATASKNENYTASLRNEVLAAAWIIGLLASNGGSPCVPEPVRIAFRCFSDINDHGTYMAPRGSLLQTVCHASVNSKFNLTKWWDIAEGDKLIEPFDVGEELVAGLLRVLQVRLSGAELRARTIQSFKELLQRQQDITSRVEDLTSYLADEYERFKELLPDE